MRKWICFITGHITDNSHEARTPREYKAAREETDDSIADRRGSGDYFENLILGAFVDPYTKLLGEKQKMCIICSAKDSLQRLDRTDDRIIDSVYSFFVQTNGRGTPVNVATGFNKDPKGKWCPLALSLCCIHNSETSAYNNLGCDIS